MIPLDSSAVQRASSGNPAWLAAARAEAFELYESLDMPSPTEEVWRYVDLDFSLADYQLPVSGPAIGAAGSGSDARITVVDGIAVDDGLVTPQFSLISLASALAGEDALLEDRYDGFGAVEADKFSSAHRAFGLDGAHVRIADRAAVTDPIFVDVRATVSGAVSFPRVLIEAGAGSEASVVVDLSSPDDIDALVVPEVEISVEANATLRLTLVQDLGSGTTSIGRAHVTAARDAQVVVAEAGLGGALARLHLAVDLQGKGSAAQIIGAFFGERDQVLDYRYFMRHVGESTNSDMFLKGAVEDQALSIFTGMIRIEEQAQRTNAFQTNRNLLLSDDAAAQSVPNLEILANDVKCGHASTVGPLDEEQRYYLMSRGLDEKCADRLQVRGFFEEALARFPVQSVAAPLRDRINAKYVQEQREGRV